MTNFIKLSCVLDTTDSSSPLGMEIYLDDLEIFNNPHITGPMNFEYCLDDDDATHNLVFIMKGKLPEHTKLSDTGEIIGDARLIIKDIAFDQIELGQVFIDKSTYTHNFNNTQGLTVDKFYGEMGCNGSVTLEFTTPIYLWLLENL